LGTGETAADGETATDGDTATRRDDGTTGAAECDDGG
jgi:hypothetical protein